MIVVAGGDNGDGDGDEEPSAACHVLMLREQIYVLLN